VSNRTGPTHRTLSLVLIAGAPMAHSGGTAMADPRVFISYSHDSEDHREAVLQLAQQLRGWGVDVHLDRFVTAPDVGWRRWMMAEVDAADFVVLVCTPTYRRRFEGQEAAGQGKGVTFEGLLAIQHLNDANTRNHKFIPVAFAGVAEADIPLVLRPYTRYVLPGQLEPLYRHITGQPEVVAAALGPRKVLPPRGAAAPPPTAATSPVASGATSTRAPLAAATVCSEGGRDVHIEPAELLLRLLLAPSLSPLVKRAQGHHVWPGAYARLVLRYRRDPTTLLWAG
jgi:hypothetical protein